MYLWLVLLIVLLGLASQLGWSTDSRDSADWKPSEDGARTSCR